MPSDVPGVHIKPTGSVSMFRIVALTAFCLILAGAGNAAAGGGMYWLFLVILWPPGIALALVINRARLTATGDVLTYRGPLRTRAWQREEIEAFWLDRSGGRTFNVHIGMDTVTGEHVAFRAIQASSLADKWELDCWRAALWDWLEAADELEVADEPSLD
jgi:hypothetical protein